MHSLADRRDVQLPPSTVAVVVEEFRQRGLLRDVLDDRGRVERFELTDAGNAFASAKATKRVPRVKAKEVFDTFLRNCADVNARDDLPFRVKDVWLFGSMLDERKPDVGDVDFVATFESTVDDADWDDMSVLKRYRHLGDELGVRGQSGVMYWPTLVDRVRECFVYGKRKSPVLAPNDIDQLKALGCPCRCVFDTRRGGLVDDPVLPLHPDSPGRSNQVRAPAVMPEIDVPGGPVAPVPIDLAVPPQASYVGDIERFSSGYSAFEMHFRDVGRTPVIVSKADGSPLGPVAFEGLDLGACDGRGTFALLMPSAEANSYEPWKGPFDAGMIVKRSIEQTPDETVYDVKIEQYAEAPASIHFEPFEMMHWAVDVAMRTDLERIFRREAEAGVRRRLAIKVHTTPELEEHGDVESMVYCLGVNADGKVLDITKLTGHESDYEFRPDDEGENDVEGPVAPSPA